MSLYTIGWLAWIVWFLLEEGVALAKGGAGATLSAHVWWWFGTSKQSYHLHPTPSPWLRLRRVLCLAVMAWLTFHFMSGGLA